MREGIQSELSDAEVCEYGCYALCLIQWAADEARKGLPDEEVLQIINHARKERWIIEECYVAAPIDLWSYVYGKHIAGRIIKTSCFPGSAGYYIVCNKKPMYTHFTLYRDGKIWDPLPPDRPGAAAYRPASYRCLVT
jgi:hypothetical protein